MNSVRAEFNRRKKARQSKSKNAGVPKPRKKKPPPKLIVTPTDPNSPSFFPLLPKPKKVHAVRREAPPPPEPKYAPRWIDLANDIEGDMVFREQHPYNVFHGRVESPMGFPNKLYRKTSYLDLLIDTALQTHRQTHGMQSRRTPVETPFDDLFDNTRPVEKNERAFNEGWCVNDKCTERAKKDFSLSHDKSAYVCNVCGVIQPILNAISMHREKNCAEDEDGTTRGDVVHESTTDHFMMPVRPASEVVRAEEIKYTQARHLIGKHTRDRLKLGFAPEIADRGAAKSSDIFGNMEKHHRTRITNIERELERTFKEMNNANNALLEAQMRRQTFHVFTRICEHVKHCPCDAKNPCKYEPLLQYPSSTFAKSMIDVELKRLQTKSGPPLEGVDAIEIDRFAANLAGLRAQHMSRGVQAPSGASFGIAKSLLASIVALDSCAVIPPCEPKEPKPTPCSPVRAVHRSDSAASLPDDPKIVLRNAIADVLASFGRFFVADIQKFCFDALQRVELAQIESAPLEHQAIVFVMCVQQAVVARDEARGVVNTCTLKLDRLNPNLLVRLNEISLDVESFTSSVTRMQRVVSMDQLDVLA